MVHEGLPGVLTLAFHTKFYYFYRFSSILLVKIKLFSRYLPFRLEYFSFLFDGFLFCYLPGLFTSTNNSKKFTTEILVIRVQFHRRLYAIIEKINTTRKQINPMDFHLVFCRSVSVCSRQRNGFFFFFFAFLHIWISIQFFFFLYHHISLITTSNLRKQNKNNHPTQAAL